MRVDLLAESDSALHRLLLGAVFLFLLVCLAPSAHAQGYGTIVGTITDPAGSVIPGAKITVVDQSTQLSRDVSANAQGYYVVPSLRPSVYSITVTAPSFAVFAEKNVTLLVDQSLTVDVKMTLGRNVQTVSVQSNPVQVDTTTSTLSQVVEEKRIVDLPLNGRNPVDLALLVPGTILAPSNNANQASIRLFR
jgi:hypothetical protein